MLDADVGDYLGQCLVATDELRVVGVDVCMLTVNKIPNHTLSRGSAFTDKVLNSCPQSHLHHQEYRCATNKDNYVMQIMCQAAACHCC